MPRFVRNRRDNDGQREAVDRVLAEVSGVVTVRRADDGSVFVYDEHREWLPPTTLRVRITTSGEVEAADRLRL